ncbi:MAG: DUF3347 domain-containing protein [Bacteroidetes bacterium]|nr:DUF3347 domain-containing protein [Bacteroidota bacterium]MBS1642297.1 DUF3347 domain-containing protein [Bacteroidota bacterium]MBS1672283.1 DUF3347 domain-containing protein [Bacteroidota bacterium]
MKNFLLIILLAFIASCGSSDKKSEENKPQPALSKSNNTDVFNIAFEELMNNYYHLKDNFITESDTIINVYARKLIVNIDSLPLTTLKADTNVIATAKATAQSISAELNGLLAEKNIEAKRKSFATLSEEMYDLIRTVQYDKATVYHAHCPMAFNGVGANWLSNSADIKNPYIPKQMLSCGEVTDSINFAKK